MVAIMPLRGEGFVTISGEAPGVTVKKFEVYRTGDPVTNEMISLGIIMPDEDGKFSISLSCDGIETFRFRYGIYDLYLIAEEDNNYTVRLPEFRDLSEADRQNPYFGYRNIHLRTEEESQNNIIRTIDSVYFKIVNEITHDIYLRESKDNYDIRISGLTGLATGNMPFTSLYLECRIMLAKMVSDQGKYRDKAIETLDREFNISNRAYSDLVFQVFNGILKDYLSGDRASLVRRYINSSPSASELGEMVAADFSITNSQLLEYVLLMNLYYEYYLGSFVKGGVLRLIRWYATNGTNGYTRYLAGRMARRIERFMKGENPPWFSLNDRAGRIVTPDTLRGKYLLLSFGSSDSWQTLSEFNLMKSWKSEYGKDLNIVTILTDDDFIDGVAKMEGYGYDWTFLDGSNNPGLERDYDIRYLPAFFLIDRNGSIISAPAPMPSENLGRLLFEQLQRDLVNNISN